MELHVLVEQPTKMCTFYFILLIAAANASNKQLEW